MKRGLADGALLVLLVLAAFASALPNGWVWDDDDYITANPTLTSGEGLRRIWADRSATPQYYPLVHTTFWVERRVWGTETDPATGREVPRAFGYHLDNVLLHALGAVLLWRLLRRLNLTGAWFAAALFALHPVTVESVAWVTERKNVLSLALALGSALAFLGWVRDARAGRLALSVLLFAGALLSKTIVASLPAVLVLLLWWRRETLGARVVVPLALMLALGGWLGWQTAVDERLHVGAEGASWQLGPVERTLIAGRALWFYAGKLVLPVNLTFSYPRWEIDARAAVQYVFPAAALLVVLALFALRERLGRGPLVAVLIFGGVLFPALGFLNVFPHQYSFVADHFQYHAAAALLAALASLLARVPLFRPARGGELDGPLGARQPPAALAGWGLLLAVLGTATFVQCRDYRDRETLWLSVIERNPGASLAYNNLGVMAYERGDRAAAVSYLEQAIEAWPDNAEALNNLGQLYLLGGRPADAERVLLRAVEIAPQYVKPLVNLGHLYRGRGDPARAIEFYERANRANPAGPIPQVGVLLGDLLVRQGRAAEAVPNLRAGLLNRETSEEAAIALMWVFATHPDDALRSGAEAVALAERLRASGRALGPRALDAMAAAHAEAGRFDEAQALARRAALAADAAGRPGLAAAIRERERLYAAGRPARTRAGYPE